MKLRSFTEISDKEEHEEELFDPILSEEPDPEEIEDMLANTANSPEQMIRDKIRKWSKAELKQIWDNDPGYINDKVRKRMPGEEKKQENEGELDLNGLYLTEGYHRDLIDWGQDSVENSERETALEPGTIVKRAGNENGRYLAERDTDFSKLHLPVSEDKLNVTEYEVLRSLPVTESLIAPQRFDEEGSECEKPAKQFRTRLMVRELVEQGYLKRIELSREMDDQRR